MSSTKNAEPQFYSHASRLRSQASSYPPSSRVPSARVAGTRGQPGKLPQDVGISHIEEMKKDDRRTLPSTYGRFSEGPAAVGRQKQLIDEASIVQPASKQPLARRIRPPTERMPASTPPHPAQAPWTSFPPEPPKIDRRNLGSLREALHSHPVTQVSSAQRSSVAGDDDTKAQHRKYVICETDEDDSVLLMRPKGSVDPSTDRRQGRVFATERWEIGLQEILRPESWSSIEEEKGKEKPSEPTIPTIKVSPPSDGETQPVSPGLLTVDSTYKILHKKSKKENRHLSRRLQSLQPLAWLVSEAEGIDVNDTVRLAEALRTIIDDRQMLINTLPLAVTLCADQGIEFNDDAFEALPQALDKVLFDREQARIAASHHKKARKLLESRVNQLESELLRSRHDGRQSN
ncbi:hypothetical protein GGS21DRAFT_229647 [Xylaria nigripes]|nr:hypothetical protein GGS21DRAFT_229647 [Xylaria nigripes]